MSTRAIRALRAESSSNAEIAHSLVVTEFDSDDGGSEDMVERHRTPPISFSILRDDSDGESLHEEDERVKSDDHADGEDSQRTPIEIPFKTNEIRFDAAKSNVSENEVDEDIDALLSEFQEMDCTQILHGSMDSSSISNETFPFDFILKSFDARDLDVDFTMRTSMLHAARVDERLNQTRKLQASSLFGPPMDGWIRPPRYVGGGIGMTPYDSLNDQSACVPPWPYSNSTYRTAHSSSDVASTCNVPELPLSRWITFLFSDLATRDVRDYFTIQRTGDVNALIMFVSHHPYVTEALLQLSSVLYQTNHSSEGLSLLRRCLWIYESSSLPSLVSHLLQGKAFLMDSDRKENRTFFQSLFRLMQVSCASGLYRTSLAACRLLLSLDPLRDPMNVLLSLDCHTIAVGRDYGYKDQIYLLRWLVDLVDLDLIHIWYRDTDEGSSTSYRCSLLDLPNWAYSYALALFDLHSAIKSGGNDVEFMDSFENVKCKADSAIQRAISRYPAVVGFLLHNLDVDTSGRSFHHDWLPVLEKISLAEHELARYWHSASQASLVLSATIQTCDLITKIYARQSAKLYADDSIVQWIYDNLVDVLSKEQLLPDPPNRAILRYATVDPTDYDVKFQMLPPDVNAIDIGLLAHAMLINPNRPRYLRRPHPSDDEHRNEVDVHEGLFVNNTRHLRSSYFGPPTESIDPDWPMLEVFWRSLLPWNYVEGMPHPR